jgi:hypothetical protein
MSLIAPSAVFLVAVAMAAVAGARMTAPISTSAWLMPLIVTIAMAIVSAVIVIGEVMHRTAAAWTTEGPQADASLATSTPLRIAGWLALSGGYAVVTPMVGFEWATGIFLVLALKVFGGASWRITVPVAVGMALLVPLIFRRVFYTLVP